MLTFQQTILTLQQYWDRQGCALLQPYDMEVGAGTFHPATTEAKPQSPDRRLTAENHLHLPMASNTDSPLRCSFATQNKPFSRLEK